VVTTAALAAGVDFPASQVIFESLAMGIEWLTVREFQQMLGRAGRPDYHDLGIVVLLADPERRFGKGDSEDEIAFRLLRGELEHFGVDYGDDEQLEETLSNIVIAHSLSDIGKLNEMLLGKGNIDFLLNKLKEYGFIEKKMADTSNETWIYCCFSFPERGTDFPDKEAVLKGIAPWISLPGLRHWIRYISGMLRSYLMPLVPTFRQGFLAPGLISFFQLTAFKA